jgi:hypothetical protein
MVARQRPMPEHTGLLASSALSTHGGAGADVADNGAKWNELDDDVTLTPIGHKPVVSS